MTSRQVEHVGQQLAWWQRRAEAAATTTTISVEEENRRIDQAEMAAIRAQQAANRNLAYVRRRPSRYAEARYAGLQPAQDPDGLASRWLASGPRTLLLAGPSRTGKTTTAFAIANDANDSGQWVMARTAADLSAALKPDSDEPLAYQHSIECDLLLLDDVGRERATDWWLEQLHRIVDVRCSNDRRLIATTNTAASADQAYDQLVQRYGDPIVERLIDDGGVLVLDGPPVRRITTTW